METKIPQIIYFCLLGVSLLISGYRHGKPKTGKHNLFVDLISTLISAILLYFGGFFHSILN